MSFTLDHIHFRYPSALQEAVSDISCQFPQGERIGLLGPNGSGKTTLLKLMAGLLSPTQGQVSSTEKSKNNIAFVPQDENIFLPFSVEQIVLMGRSPFLNRWGFEKKEDREKAAEAMHQTDIWQKRSQLLQELSGGEKQRVFLARALAQEAPWILLDEPTTHLDIRHQMEFLGLCRSLNESRKTTFVMTLHDVNLASHYATRLVFLKNGSLVAQGSPQETLTTTQLQKIYDTPFSTVQDPRTGLPYFFPAPGVYNQSP